MFHLLFFPCIQESGIEERRVSGAKDTNLKPILINITLLPYLCYKYTMTFQSCQALIFRSLKFIMKNACSYQYLTQVSMALSLSEKKKKFRKNRLTNIDDRLVVAKGEGGGRGMYLEFEVSRCKLLHLEWINNKVLLHSSSRELY